MVRGSCLVFRTPIHDSRYSVGYIQLSLYIVPYPVRVPPLLRIYKGIPDENAEMEMIAPGKARGVTPPNGITLFDVLTLLYVDHTEMTVETEQSETVVDNNAISIDSEITAECDGTAVRSFNEGVLCGRKIHSHVNAFTDVFSLIPICPSVPEHCHGGGIFHSEKSSLPQLFPFTFSAD